MYQLEDRILFDGAAVVDAAAAQQAFQDQQAAAQEAADAADQQANQEAEQQNPSQDGGAQAGADGGAHDGAADDAHDAALGLDSKDVQDFLTDTLGGTVADGSLKVYIAASDSLELEALRDSADDSTIVIEYGDDTTKADLMRMLSETLNGRKAESITFLDADGDAAADDATAERAESGVDRDHELAADYTADEFQHEVADYLTGDGDADYVDMTALYGDADGDADHGLTGDDANDADDADDDVALDDADDDAAIAGDHDVIDDYAARLDILNQAPEQPHEIVFVDSRVRDLDQILASIDPTAEIVFLSGTDTMDQINDYLAQYDGEVDAIHFITHGTDGVIKLGDQDVNFEYLTENRDQFVQWGNALSEHGDIMFYGCNIARGSVGQQLVNALAAITGADVAASFTPVGKGSWDLGYRVGTIDTATITVGDYDNFLAQNLYRSKADGAWENVDNWEIYDDANEKWLTSKDAVFGVPDSDAITITITHKIDVTLDLTISSEIIVADKGVLTVYSDMDFTGAAGGTGPNPTHPDIITVEAGGTLAVASGGTLTLDGPSGLFTTLRSDGGIVIADGGKIVVASGNIQINGSINATVQPEKAEDPRNPSNMLDPKGILSQTGGEIHFRGAEIATVVQQTGGSFYYDGLGSQAIAGSQAGATEETYYSNVTVSGGTKTLWLNARIDGQFQFAGDTDVRLGGYDIWNAYSFTSYGSRAELSFDADATVVNGGGAFIYEYQIGNTENDKGEQLTPAITVRGGQLAFQVSATNKFNVVVGTELFRKVSDDREVLFREWSMLQLKGNAANAATMNVALRVFWQGDIDAVGKDVGYAKMGFRLNAENSADWQNNQVALNIIGYSRGAVSDNFSYAMASIYQGEIKVPGGDNQFNQWLTQDGIYSFRSRPVDASCLLVTNNLDDPSTIGMGSLRVAVDYANRFGGEITFAKALSGQTIDLTLMELQVTGAVEIVGLTGKNRVTISGSDANQIFRITSTGVLTLTDLNLTQGYTGGSGGAIFNGGILKYTNGAITDSEAGFGGAIFNATGSVSKLYNVVISGNTASTAFGDGFGGALYVSGGSLFYGERVKMSGNTALGGKGGAIYVGSGEGELDKDGNPVVKTEGGSVQMKYSTIDHNTADEGSALYLTDATTQYDEKYKVMGPDGKEEELTRKAVMHLSGSAMLDSVTINDNITKMDAATGAYTGSTIYIEGKFYGVNLTVAHNKGAGFLAKAASSLTLENTTVAFNVMVAGSTANTGILFDKAGAQMALTNVLDVDDNYLATDLSGAYVNASLFGRQYLTDPNVFIDGQLRDNGGWVQTLALKKNVTAHYDRGETNLDARGFIFHDQVYDHEGKALTVWRSVGSYQFQGAVAWNSNNNYYFTDIQSAIDAAKSGDEIQLAKTRITSEYFQYNDYGKNGVQINISKDLVLLGQGMGSTVLDANGTRIFNIADQNNSRFLATIGGMDLINGNGEGNGISGKGGAIYNTENLVLVEVGFYDNHVAVGGQGGAIYNEGGYVVAERVIFNRNETGDGTAGYQGQGGAIYSVSSAKSNANLLIVNSEFTNNITGEGGAIYQKSLGQNTAALYVNGALFDNNEARLGSGGAVWAEGLVDLENTTVAFNAALDGSALDFNFVGGKGKWSLTNVTVAWNEASGAAVTGALAVNGGTLSLVNSLIALNNNTYDATGNYLGSADVWNLNSQGNKITNVSFKHKNSVYQFRVNQPRTSTSNPANAAWQYDPVNRMVNGATSAADAIFDFQYRLTDVAGDTRWYGRLEDRGGWTRTLALRGNYTDQVELNGNQVTLSHVSKLINAGTSSGAQEFDQRGYLVNGTRDIGAFEYNGFIGMATFFDPAKGKNVTIGIQSLNDINGFSGNYLSGNRAQDDTSLPGLGPDGSAAAPGQAYKDITVTLANTRVIDHNVQLNTIWVESHPGTDIGGGRVISILGAAEGGTVLDADSTGPLITAWGGWYYTPGNTVYVMGTVNLERLTVTGAVGGYGSAIGSKENYTPAGGSINFKDVQLVNNISRLGGGAIYGRVHGDGDAQKDVAYNFNRSLVAYNITAGSGGAIYAGTGVSATNSTFAYNAATGVGGAFAIQGPSGSVTLDGVTVAFNDAAGVGGGGGVYNNGTLAATNSLLAKNRTASAYADHIGNFQAGYNDYDYRLVGDSKLSVQIRCMVEVQNGEYFGEGAAANFFAPLGPEDTKTQLTYGALLGFRTGTFRDGYIADHGGWTDSIALGYTSDALDATRSRTTDQRGYEYASGNMQLDYRDIGAFELNGAFITVTNSLGKVERFNDFNRAMAWADSGSTLTVKAVRIKAHDIEIDKSVVITLDPGADKGSFPLTRGEHSFIDAGFQGRVFNISNSQATVGMDGLYLYNGVALIASADAPTSASGNGGLIYNSGSLTLNNVSASNGFAQQFGGAVFSSKSLTVKADGAYGLLPSAFDRNRAIQGGAIFVRGAFVLTGAGAHALTDQAGVPGDPWATSNDNNGSVQFRANRADDGAALFIGNLTAAGNLTGAYFAANQGANQGGAVYASRNAGMNFTNAYFFNNMALSEGGGLYVSGGSLAIHDSLFDNNTAFQSGGALQAIGVDTITIHASSSAATVFQNNVAVYGSGGAIYVDGFSNLAVYSDSLLTGVAFNNNQTIHGSGGAIYVQNGKSVQIGTGASNANTVVFFGNQAGTDDRNAQAKNATVAGVVSGGAYNDMMNEYANGGAIYGLNIGSVALTTNVSLVQNSAFTYGGGIYLERVGTFSTAKNVSFLYNLAGHSGGTKWEGVFDAASMPAAKGAGGAAYLVNVATTKLDYTKIAGNYAGFFNWSKFFQYAVEEYRGNGQRIAYRDGGGFYIKSDFAQEPAPTITMNDMDVFDNNRVLTNDQVVLQLYTLGLAPAGTKFIGLTESSEARGGAFYISSPNATLVVTNSGFDANEALLGGAFYLAGDTAATVMKSASFTNVSFGDNYGTALRIDGLNTSLTLNYVTFGYNRVDNNRLTNTTGLYFGGFKAATAGAKFALSITNSIFFEEAGTPVELKNLVVGDQLSVTSRNNIYYRMDKFSINGQLGDAAQVLTGKARKEIWAYDTHEKYGYDVKSIKIAGVLDANGNIVGGDKDANKGIKDNLFLAKEMAYHANYLTRAMALESKNSIAYHYRLSKNGAEVRPGEAGDVATDQRGNVRTGLKMIPVVDADGRVTYTYEFYLFNAAEQQWYFVSVADGQPPVMNAVEKPGGTSLGAFEPNFYMAVTSNLDNRTNGFSFIKATGDEWHDISTALTSLLDGGTGGITLREALYWMDNYTLGSTANSSGVFVFDPSRYVKFSDSLYSDGKNTIVLESGQITIKQDVVVGMIDNYQGYRFKADSTFRAQDDLSRITISGNDRSRIFYIDNSEDYTMQMMRALTTLNLTETRDLLGEAGLVGFQIQVVNNISSLKGPNGEQSYMVAMNGGLSHAAQVGLNNLTLTNGYQGFNTLASASGSSSSGGSDAGRGGAIFNEGRLEMHNVVVKNSTATNADFDPGADDGSFAGWGGGIFNDRKLQSFGDMIMSVDAKTQKINVGVGFYRVANGELYLYDSTVTNNLAQGNHLTGTTNFAGFGGGIANVGDALIVRSTIDHNHAQGFHYNDGDSGRYSAFGGGIYNGSYTYVPTLLPMTLGNLTPEQGQTKAVYSGSLSMYSSTVTGNYNSYAGAGPYVYGAGGAAIHVSGGQAVLVGNTIALNVVHQYADGMGYAVTFNNEMRDGAANYLLANNIIANNFVNGINPVVGRDILLASLNVRAEGTSAVYGSLDYTINSNNILITGGNNIIGSLFGYISVMVEAPSPFDPAQTEIYYTGISTYPQLRDQFSYTLGNNTWGKQENGYVDKLFLSNELKYNGGMTKNLRLGAGSIAYTLNNGSGNYRPIYDFDGIQNPGGISLKVLDPVFGDIYASAYGDQRGLTYWGYDAEGYEVTRDPQTNAWVRADGQAAVGKIDVVQVRNTIGAYEMLTYVVSDTSVADQPLIGGNIHYDYSYRSEDGQRGRNGWDVNLRQALYLADSGATVIFKVAAQTEVAKDANGNVIYQTEANGQYKLDHFGERMVKTQNVKDAKLGYLYYDRFELVYGEMNVFNSLTFQVVAATDPAGKVHGLTIDANGASRAFNIDGANFEVPSAVPLKVTIEGIGAQLLILDTAATGSAAKEQQGGAIYANGHLTLRNIDFRDSTAAADGGAIYVANGNLTLRDVNFNRKVTAANNDHGYISAGGSGGAVYVEGAVDFENVTMYFTTADNDGGAVYVANALTASRFKNVTIGDVDAKVGVGGFAMNGNGGAIYFVGADLTLENVFIANSIAQTLGDTSYGLGGAIYVSSSGNVIFGNATTGLGVTMTNNQAVSGGAIYVANAKLFQMSQGSIVNNAATGYPGAYGHGGGIYVAGYAGMTIQLVNTTVANNTATANGGGIYIGDGDVTLQSVTLANNIAGYKVAIHVPSDRFFGGGIFLNSGKLSLNNSIVAQNFANFDKSIADAVKPNAAIRDDIYVDQYRVAFGDMIYSIIGELSGQKIDPLKVNVTGSALMGDGKHGTEEWKTLELMTSVYEFPANFEIDGRIPGFNYIPTYIVYVYSDLGGKDGNDAMIGTLDQLGRPRTVASGEITMGAYQKITVFFTLEGDLRANVGTNWFNTKTGKFATSDSIFMLPDAVFQINSKQIAVIDADYNQGLWHVGALGKIEMNGNTRFNIAYNNRMIGRLNVNDQSYLYIDAVEANIKDMVFTVNSFDTTVHYGEHTDVLRTLEYGNLRIDSNGLHRMTADSGVLKVNGLFEIIGLNGKSANELQLATADGKPLEITVGGNTLIQGTTAGTMRLVLTGALTVGGDLNLTHGALHASGGVLVTNWIIGTGADSEVSGADITFGSARNVGLIAASGDVLVKMAGGQSALENVQVTAGGDINFANAVTTDGAVTVSALGSIVINGELLVASGSLGMTAAADLTFNGGVTIAAGVTRTDLTGGKVTLKGNLISAGGVTTITALNSLSFNGYAYKVKVQNDSHLNILLQAEQDLYLVGDDDPAWKGKNPLFDVRNIEVDPNAWLNFSTKGELVLGKIEGTAADGIKGTLELNSGKVIVLGENNKPLEINFARVIFGTDVEVAGQLISINYGMEFRGTVTIRAGVGDVTFLSRFGMVKFFQALTGNGDSVTITGREVLLNAISGVDDLTVTATGTGANDTITLSAAVTVTGDIKLLSQNPIQVIGDSALKGYSLEANAALVGTGSLLLDFSPNAPSNLKGIAIDGMLTLAAGNYTIGYVTAGGMKNAATTQVTGDARISGALTNTGALTVGGALRVSGNLINSGALTANGSVTVTDNLTNSGTFLAKGSVAVTGELFNQLGGLFTVDGVLAVGGDLRNAGTFVANRQIFIGGSLINSGSFEANGEIDLGGDLVTDGSFTATKDVVVKGNLTSTGSFTATKGVEVGGNLTSGGLFTVADDLTVGKSLNSTGILTVGGNVAVGQNLNMNGTLTIGGNATVLGNWTSQGAATIGGALLVGGNLNYTGDANSVFSVRKSVTVGKNMMASGTFETLGALAVGGTLNATGVMTVGGDVRVTGDMSVGALSSHGDIVTGGTLTAHGSLFATGNIDADGNVVAEDTLTVGGNLTSRHGAVTLRGAARIDGALDAYGTISAAGPLQVGGGVTARHGSVVLHDTAWIGGDLTASDAIVLYGAFQGGGDVTAQGGSITAHGDFVTAGTVRAAADLAALGNFEAAAVYVDGAVLAEGTFAVAAEMVVGGDLTNRGTGFTVGDQLTLAGNLTNSGALQVGGTLQLNGTTTQLLNLADGETRVGRLVLANAAGAELVGRSNLTVDGAFVFQALAGRMGLGDGRLDIGGAIVGNSRSAYFMGGGAGMVYFNLSAANLAGNALWIGSRDYVGKVAMSSRTAGHVVGVGTSAPVTENGQPNGRPIYLSDQAYDRLITIDTGDSDLNVNLSEAYEPAEFNQVKKAVLYGNSDGKWRALKPEAKGSDFFTILGRNALTYAVPDFNFSPNPPPNGAYNLYQRDLRDMDFQVATIHEPGRNQYLLSLENMRSEWLNNAETNPLNIQLERSGSAMAAPVRLGLLGGYTVYGSPIDSGLLDDGVTLNPEDNNRVVTLERDEANDRANWMEAFATLAERDAIQERHPAFQDSVDRALEAFLMA